MTLLRAQSGTVYAEFLVAFTPFFLLFLGGVQLALIAQARIVVQHAASCAVRAAIVSIDDDPVFYDDGTRKVLSTDGSGRGQKSSFERVESMLGSKQPAAGVSTAGDGEKLGSGRLNRVRNAAYLPLSVLGPSPGQVFSWLGHSLGVTPESSLAEAVGESPLQRVLLGLTVWSRVASAITFPRAQASDALREPDAPWLDSEPVRVRVTYLFPCSVPVVRAFACSSLLGMEADDFLTELGNKFRKKKQPNPHKQALAELRHAEWPSAQKSLLALYSERFFVVRGEAALPNHGAPYKYASELCRTKIKAPNVACKAKP